MANTLTPTGWSVPNNPEGPIRIDRNGNFIDPDGDPLNIVTARQQPGGGVLLEAGGEPVAAGASPLAYPANGQIRWGSYGDSIARLTSGGFHDLRRVSADTSMSHERLGPWINGLSGGLFRPVFDGGVSGDGTTQMLAREAAGASANRRAIADAASIGMMFLVNSMGINDIASSIAAGASQASIDAVVNASVGRCVEILKRQAGVGIWSITPSLFGYSPADAAAPERRIAVKQFNAVLGTIITDAGGQLGSWVDVHDLVADAAGAWLPGMSSDGVHPTTNACRVIYPVVVAEMLRVAGVATPPRLAYGQQTNLYTNALFLTQNGGAGAGTATGVVQYVAAGAATVAASIVDWRGRTWQELLVTPTALDGSGNVAINMDISYPSAGILTGDVLGGDMSVYIDDGADAAPDVFTFMCRLRAAGVFSVMPAFSLAPIQKIRLAAPIDHTVAFVPIIAPSDAPATTILTVYAAADTLRPFRVRVALPRVFKLPAAY